MAIVLTNAIPVPNIQRAVLVRPPRLFDTSAVLDWEIRSAGGGRIKSYQQIIRNGGVDGKSDAIMVNASPVAFDDDIGVRPSHVELVGAVDGIEAAYRSGASKAAALRAVETYCLANNLVQVVGSVQ